MAGRLRRQAPMSPSAAPLHSDKGRPKLGWHGAQNTALQRWHRKPTPWFVCQALHEKALSQGSLCPRGWAQEDSGMTELPLSPHTYGPGGTQGVTAAPVRAW